MFVGREKELSLLKKEFLEDTAKTILVYGKRRVGKTSLIKEASKAFNGIVIFYEAVQAENIINLDGLASSIALSFNERKMSFATFEEVFQYLGQKKEKILLLIDEYPELVYGFHQGSLDSVFMRIINNLSSNIKLILSGSEMSIMKALLEEKNPLFGRFDLVIKLNEFDYKVASLLYKGKCSTKKKIEFYSVFGGLPYISSLLDGNKTLEENVSSLLIDESGKVRLYIEYTLKQELSKAKYAQSILLVLGNGKKRYTEIENLLGGDSSGRLAQQLEYLINLEIIKKVTPINKPQDKKKTFYTISNNLVRFYYTYILRNNGSSNLLSPFSYYSVFVSPTIETFISYRFEDIVKEYFELKVLKGNMKGILNIGTYWYDNKKEKKNGEFDVVLKTFSGYEVYEVKYQKKPITKKECESEEEQIRAVADLKNAKIGFISLSGFAFNSSEYALIPFDKLYS